MIPRETAAQVLFRSDRTCCICRERGKAVQIHHIDEDPSNHDSSNLAALCFDCHEQTRIRGGFSRRVDAHQVIESREDWHQRVLKRRDLADALASARAVVVSVSSQEDARGGFLSVPFALETD